MAFNGAGLFVRLYNWVQDRNNGIKILATRMDAEMDGFATGLSTCITKDGQQTVMANIPFNNNKITLLAAGTIRTDAVNLGQLQSSSGQVGSASGSGNYIAALTPTLTGYSDGMALNIYFADTNATSGTATLNIDANGAINIVNAQGSPLKRNTIISGMAKVVYYGSKFYYTPPVSAGLYGLYDGGSIANNATAAVNRSFTFDTTSTSGTIATDQSATVGDRFALTKFGTNAMTIVLGSQLFNGSSAVPVTTSEGNTLMTYTGAARGWVEG